MHHPGPVCDVCVLLATLSIAEVCLSCTASVTDSPTPSWSYVEMDADQAATLFQTVEELEELEITLTASLEELGGHVRDLDRRQSVHRRRKPSNHPSAAEFECDHEVVLQQMREGCIETVKCIEDFVAHLDSDLVADAQRIHRLGAAGPRRQSRTVGGLLPDLTDLAQSSADDSEGDSDRDALLQRVTEVVKGLRVLQQAQQCVRQIITQYASGYSKYVAICASLYEEHDRIKAKEADIGIQATALGKPKDHFKWKAVASDATTLPSVTGIAAAAARAVEARRLSAADNEEMRLLARAQAVERRFGRLHAAANEAVERLGAFADFDEVQSVLPARAHSPFRMVQGGVLPTAHASTGTRTGSIGDVSVTARKMTTRRWSLTSTSDRPTPLPSAESSNSTRRASIAEPAAARSNSLSGGQRYSADTAGGWRRSGSVASDFFNLTQIAQHGQTNAGSISVARRLSTQRRRSSADTSQRGPTAARVVLSPAAVFVSQQADSFMGGMGSNPLPPHEPRWLDEVLHSAELCLRYVCVTPKTMGLIRFGCV